MSDARIVTILFTDLVGSTQLADRHGDHTAEQVRRAHFGLLRDALTEHGGQEVKSVGDGQMAVFPSAVDAVACATDFQRSVDRHNRRPGTAHALEVRVGLHVGEPIREGDDYYGSTVNIASRLCNAARGGQILASDLVRALTRTQSSAQFLRLDAIELKGIDEPVDPFEVVWSPATGAELPLPPALTTATRSSFVGRDTAFESLQTEWKRALSGERRTVLIAGEPGIGKTRLARELAHEAHEEGAIVLFGRCDEDALVPYQPFVEALRFYTSVCSQNDLVDQLGEAAPDLGRLVPEVGDRIAGLPAPQAVDPESERYRLFRAVARLITEAARTAPLLLVLDDLHWADRPTLALLRHVLRDPDTAPILVCGTYRDTDLDRKHPFAETLADLRRENAYERVLLRGLGHEEIVAMLEVAAAQKLDAAGMALAEALETETEGNPFFIEEIVLNLVETGSIFRDGGRWVSSARSPSQLDIPEGIREAVGRRLSRLSDHANDALAQASVLGPRFEYETLRVMAGMEDGRLARALEEARDIQLILEAELDARPAYMFAHALVRQVLYEELSLPRRQQLHLAAAEALEKSHPSDTPLGAIATHYRAAGAAADPQKAIDFSLFAGQQATTVYAFEDALRHLGAARELMDQQGADDDTRARLRRFLGDLHFVTGIDYAKGIEALEEGLRIYEQQGDEVRAAGMHTRLGRAYASFGGDFVDIPKAMEHFRTAQRILERSEPGNSLGYAHIGLAAAALWGMHTHEGLEASAKAIDIADHLGSQVLWANAAFLHGYHLFASGRLAEGALLAERGYEVADRLQNGPSAFFAAWVRGFIALMSGDARTARTWYERELAEPRVLEAPQLQAALRAQLAQALFMLGDTAALRAVHTELVATDRSEADGVGTLVRVVDGDLDGVDGYYGQEAERHRPTGNVLQIGATAYNRAGVLIDLGRFEEAIPQAEFAAECAEEHVVALYWNLSYLAVALAATERITEAEAAVSRARALVPSGEHWPSAHQMMAVVEGTIFASHRRYDEAESKFDEAARIAQDQGFPFMKHWTLRQWGRCRKASGNREGADAKFDELAEAYRADGFGSGWFEHLEAERR